MELETPSSHTVWIVLFRLFRAPLFVLPLALAGADGDGSLLAVAREREAHFLDETLSVELVAGELPGAERREIEVEGETATLSLEVVAR